MELIRGRHNLEPAHRGCAVTIGAFDGVHLGHQSVLTHLTEEAAKRGVPTTVVIFEPLPREYLRPLEAPPRITTLRDKWPLLEACGVDRVLCLPFNERLRQLSAREFVEKVFVEGLGVQYLAFGDDFRFGNRREGDLEYVRALADEFGYAVAPTPTCEVGGERVSSTRIRKALGQADFEAATRLLGRPFEMSGRVQHGQKLGRQLDTPTANIALHRIRSPLQGVYVVNISGAGMREVAGVANVGVKPTIGSSLEATLEAHVLEGSPDLYGQRLTVRFVHKLRDEKKFPSLDALKAGIAADKANARAWLRNHG
ncbi:MAG: bifunctional riboflavin kinase/FAD synthetase [Luminiphilus sp.]|nr:bifunctional riboflavin kinase/FAD synthetase [Luminiphilus sp.]